jgi:hypothetical protein
LERITAELTRNSQKSEDYRTPQALPEQPGVWEEDPSVGSWWPTTEEGLIVTKGDFFWIGHDPLRQRLYYYTFSM